VSSSTGNGKKEIEQLGIGGKEDCKIKQGVMITETYNYHCKLTEK
jgi:hypothetical protein